LYSPRNTLSVSSSSGLPPMPICFCVTYGCCSSGKDPISGKPLGRNVDGRTFKSHAVADSRAAFRAAEEKTEAVLAAEMEEITAHLSASVLADSVSGPSLVPGGPLWSRDDDHQSNHDFSSSSSFPLCSPSQSLPTLLHPPSRHVPTNSYFPSPPRQTGGRRSREVELIARLSELEQEVDTLRERALEALSHLGRPLSSGPPMIFPLSDLLQSSRSLMDELDMVTFKGPAVLALKALISSKLQKIDLKLVAAKEDWNQKLSDIKAMKTPQDGVPCDTGMFFENIFQPFH
jgi:hypothetical protein